MGEETKTQRVSRFPKATQLVSGSPGIQAQVLLHSLQWERDSGNVTCAEEERGFDLFGFPLSLFH